jgi:hypothetical protein
MHVPLEALRTSFLACWSYDPCFGDLGGSLCRQAAMHASNCTLANACISAVTVPQSCLSQKKKSTPAGLPLLGVLTYTAAERQASTDIGFARGGLAPRYPAAGGAAAPRGRRARWRWRTR